jgi:hypothetical protein
MKTDSSCFGRVEEFTCLGTTETNPNSVQEEIKSRLKSGNACYRSVQNVLSYSLLSFGAECFFLQLAIVRCRMFCLTACYRWV